LDGRVQSGGHGAAPSMSCNKRPAAVSLPSSCRDAAGHGGRPVQPAAPGDGADRPARRAGQRPAGILSPGEDEPERAFCERSTARQARHRYRIGMRRDRQRNDRGIRGLPATSTVPSSWPPQVPMTGQHSNDETRPANSSRPNTTGYQLEAVRCPRGLTVAGGLSWRRCRQSPWRPGRW